MTQAAKHTPGPWLVNYQPENECRQQQVSIISEFEGCVAVLWNGPEKPDQETLDNAALIAAAPETAAERDALIAKKAALLSNNQALHSRLETECAELDNLNEAQANKIVELKALNEELAGALEAALNVAEEARKEWDAAPQGMKAGKLLCALTDKNINYRADISAIHAALAKHKAGAA